MELRCDPRTIQIPVLLSQREIIIVKSLEKGQENLLFKACFLYTTNKKLIMHALIMYV